MLGLREEIERERAGVGVTGRDGHELARSLKCVDPDVGRHEPLRRGGVGVAGADDLVDPREGPRAIRERRDRGRTASAVKGGRADEVQRVGERGIDRPVGGHRRRDGERAHPSDLRRHACHEHGGRVRGLPARHERADSLEGCRYEPQLSRRVASHRHARPLPFVKCADARVGEVECAPDIVGAPARRATQRRAFDDQIVRPRARVIEPTHRSQHGRVAAAAHRADDLGGVIALC